MLHLTRCPVCRARLTGDEPTGAPCRRCASDLSAVRAAERQAEHHQHAARRALAAGAAPLALRHARQALALVDHPTTRATLAAALTLAGDEASARAVLAAPSAN